MHQITQPRAPRQIRPPRGDVDTCQHNLDIAAINKFLRRIDDLIQARRTVVAAAIGDDAKSTAVIAPLLDLQESARMGMKAVNHMRGHFAHCHDIADDGCGLLLGNIMPSMIQQFIVIADHVIHLVHRRPAVRGNLRRTSGDNDARLRIVSASAANGLSRLAFSLACHGTSIENDTVVQPGLAGLVTHHFGFPDIQPATEGFNARRIAFSHLPPPERQ